MILMNIECINDDGYGFVYCEANQPTNIIYTEINGVSFFHIIFPFF